MAYKKLSFQEVREVVQKRYELNIAEASEWAKIDIEEHSWVSVAQLVSYLEWLEKGG